MKLGPVPIAANGHALGENAAHAKHADAVVERVRQMRSEGACLTAIHITTGVPKRTIQAWLHGECRNQTPARVALRVLKKD